MQRDVFKYNYVIFGYSGYYEVGYHDIMNLSNVKYFSSYRDKLSSKFLKVLTRITFSPKVNKFIKKLLSKFIYSRIFPFEFNNNKPLCFIFFGCNAFLFNSSYFDYLTQKYPSAKTILYMQDIVKKNPLLDIHEAKKKFDLVLSYDKNDCALYNLIYYPTPYSFYEVEGNNVSSCDVYFCGRAKERYNEILQVYKQCTNKGLKCIFFVYGVPKTMRIYAPGLIYNKLISYKTNLQYVKKSKCILEVMQNDAVGYTPRVWECIVYDKHLLSNNTTLKEMFCYNNQCMHNICDDLDSISKWINNDIKYSSDIKLSLSPINLLRFIENRI